MDKLNCIPILLLLVVFGSTSTAQSNKKYYFDIEGGLGTSICPTTFKTYKSSINLLVVEQYDVKRYRIPTIIIRGTTSRQLRKWFKLGISSGINVHNLEINTYGNYYNAITVPVQLVGNLCLLKINTKNTLESEVKSGFNFQRQHYPPIIEKGGFISSFALVLKSMRDKSQGLLIKLGYELQLDRSIFKFTSDNPIDKTELIPNTIKRHSIYMTAGIRL
jgi:hypothetical protein